MASGNTLAVFTPGAGEPPASNYATLDTRNSILVLDFDAATDEAAVFAGVWPSNYAGGGATIDLYWTATSATTGDVVWLADVMEMDPNNNDIDSDNFLTASTVTTTTDSTSGQVNKSTLTISHANLGSPAAGDPFRLRVRRNADDGADNMAGDAELICVHVKET